MLMTNTSISAAPLATAPSLSSVDMAGETPETPPVQLPWRVRLEQALLTNPWVERVGREAIAASMGVVSGPYKVAIERNLYTEMSDGIHLVADRYAPQPAGRQPVIIIRTPHNRAGGTIIGGIFPWYFATYG